jgi:hypothetical protein
MSDNTPLASHLPVLRLIGRTIPVRRVVEYGSGGFSTVEFLNRGTFPHLEILISYEDDGVWYDRLREDPRVANDPRWDLRRVATGRFCMLPLPEGCDLAFVDSSTADSRVALVPLLKNHVPVLVLHDYDGPWAYRAVAAEWKHCLVYDRATPQTAVLVMEDLLSVDMLSRDLTLA